MKKALAILCVFAVGGALLVSGCKKNDANKESKAAAEAPTEAPAEAPAEAADPAAKTDVVAGKADAEAAKADVQAPKADVVAAPEVKEPATDVKAAPAADAKAAPAADVKSPSGGTVDPAQPGTAPATNPAEKPGTVPAPGAAAEAVPSEESPHFGQEFKLPAIMVTSDLVTQPAHYSQFEAVKVRGQILGFKDKMVLVGTKTTEGLWVFAVRLEAVPQNRPLKLGEMLFLEGKLEKTPWTLEAVDSLKLKTDATLKATYDWVLAARAGEFEVQQGAN